MIQPGPKGPMMIRSMDSRGRVTVVRVDNKTQNGNRYEIKHKIQSQLENTQNRVYIY